MTKLFVLWLVLSVLLKVGHCSEGDVIVKDGHRVIVVKYDGDDKTNNRVLISPPEKEEKRRDLETTSSLPVDQLICDAIRKFKHKMATVLGRVEDLTVGRDVEDKLGHEAQYAEEKVTDEAQAQNAWVRAKILARGIGTVVAAELKIAKIGSVVSLIGIAAAYGTCVWVTLVSSLLASVLGRQQFDVVRSKVYPVYFKAISVGIVVSLLGHVLSRRRKVLTDAVDMWQAVNLMTSILMVETNGSFVEPRATKAMFERLKVEKEERRGRDTFESQSVTWIGRKKVIEKMDENEDVVKQRLKKLSERLSRYHAYSSWLNLLTLLCLTWHFVYLGHRLSLTC